MGTRETNAVYIILPRAACIVRMKQTSIFNRNLTMSGAETHAVFAGSTRNDRLFIILVVAVILLTYALLQQRYMPDNSDDAWTTSYAYNYFMRGQREDVTFGSLGGGVSLFGFLYAGLQYAVLETFGWTRSNAILLSTVLLFLSTPVWWNIAKDYGLGRKARLALCLTLPLWEPFFRIGNTARPDAFCFLLISCALLAAHRRRFFAAGLLSMLAVETHQMGILALLYTLSIALVDFWRQHRSGQSIRPQVLGLLLGWTVGCGLYIALHWPALTNAFGVIAQRSVWDGHFFWNYFFMTNTHRHLPELIALGVAICISLRYRLYRNIPEPYVFFLVTLVIGYLTPRSNFYYAVYSYVWVLIILIICAEKLNKELCFIFLSIFFLLPQYGFIRFRHNDFDMNQYVYSLKTAIPPTQLPLVGSFNDWFALYELDFTGMYNIKKVEELINGRIPFIVIIQDNIPNYTLDYIKKNHGTFHELGDIFASNCTLHAYLMCGKHVSDMVCKQQAQTRTLINIRSNK